MTRSRHIGSQAHGYADLIDWQASLRLKGRADRTISDYEGTVQKLFTWRNKPVGEYTLEDLEQFILFEYGATPGARVRISHLRSFFGWLQKRDRIGKNPAALLDPPARKSQKVIEVFSEAELERIYATDPLACLMCETGIRKSEARNLRRRHIDLQLAELTVFDGKGSKDRVVPMTTWAKVVIADMDLCDFLEPDDYIWPTTGWSEPDEDDRRERETRRATPISNTAMQGWWAHEVHGVLARAGVPYRNMHVTRHTFATRLIRRGARLENVQQLMGHSSIQTTVDLYAHVDLNDARSDLELLG